MEIATDLSPEISSGMFLKIYQENPAGIPAAIVALLLSVVPRMPEEIHKEISSEGPPRIPSCILHVFLHAFFPSCFPHGVLRKHSKIYVKLFSRFFQYIICSEIPEEICPGISTEVFLGVSPDIPKEITRLLYGYFQKILQ